MYTSILLNKHLGVDWHTTWEVYAKPCKRWFAKMVRAYLPLPPARLRKLQLPPILTSTGYAPPFQVQALYVSCSDISSWF